MIGRPLSYYNSEDGLMSFWWQNKEAYDFKDAEDVREIPFSQAYPSLMWVIDFEICLDLRIFLQLLAMKHCFILVVPNYAPNDGHIPAPMEEDDDDYDNDHDDNDHDDDDDDDDDEDDK